MTYTLDSSAQASWRTNATSVDLYLFLHQPEVVFAAQINMPIVPYPLPFIIYDNVTTGAYTDIEEDMLVLIGSTPGADDLGRTRVRMSGTADVVANSSVVFIHNSSQGAFDGEVDVVDDAYVTVLNAHWLWSVAPYITPNGLILEDFDHIFTDAVHLLPIAPAGVDFLIVLDNVGDEVTLDFGEYAAYATAPGASIVNESWSFPDGQTSTSATPQITFEADTVGYYSRTVEDSLGNIKTSWRFMAVVNKNHANLIKDFEITNHTARVDGQEMQVIIHQDIPYGTYPDGTEALIAMRERRGSTIGGLVGSPGFENMIFAGWLGQENMTGEAGRNGYLSNTTITLLDSAGKLKTLPGFTEVKEREDTPTTWAHMKGANIDRYVVSILDHRSNAARRVDIIWSGTGEDYAFTILGSDGGNLYDQADLRCQAIAYKLTCDRYGRLIMRPDPQLQAEADKTTDIIVPIAETDWSQMQRVYNRSPRTHWNWGEAIKVSTANASAELNIVTLWNVSPGNAPGQGLASATSGEQLAQSQEELNIRERKRYEARLNSLFGNIQVLLARDGYFCDPSLFKWVQLEITSEHAGVRGRSWVSTTRFLPLEMSYRYDHQRGAREQRITLEKEVVTSRTAVTYFPPNAPGFTLPPLPDYGDPSLESPFVPFGLHSGVTDLIVFMHRDISVPTASIMILTSGVPTEVTFASLGITGRLRRACVDPWSPRYIDGTGNVNGWILTNEMVCRVEDADGSPIIGGVFDLGLVANDVVFTPEMHTNIAQRNFVAVTFGLTNASIPSRDGQYYFYTLDGINWSGGLIAGSGIPSFDTTNFDAIGLAVSPHQAGYVLRSNGNAVFASNDYGITWTQVATVAGLSRHIVGIHIPFHNNADDGIFYFSQGGAPGGVGQRALLWRYDHGTVTQVTTPLSAGLPTSFFGLRGMDTYAQNRDIIALVARRFMNFSANTVAGNFHQSDDAGANWEPTDSSTIGWRSVAIAGDNPLYQWLYGASGDLYATDDGWATSTHLFNTPITGSNGDNAIVDIWGR
jgi:hypothetical protein